MPATMKPTMEDIAAKCGVHRNTVSKILKGTYDGDPNTIAHVRKVSDEIGYGKPWKAVPNPKKDEPVKDSELPKGVELIDPEVKLSPNHKWTMVFEIEVACEWEYDKDDKGNPIAESATVTDSEKRQFRQALPARPTLKEVNRHIASKKSKIPDAI